MRLVVLDTNVIVSAGLKMGSIPYRLVMDWVLEGKVLLVTSPLISGEYREVLRRPKFTRHGFPPKWLDHLIDASLQLSDPAPWPRVLPDPTDAPFLALASASGAWLVTGNLKHYPESARGRITVLSPAEYLAHIGGNSPDLESE